MTPKLVHFTLASEDVANSAAFYRAVLGARLDEVELGGEKLYRGELAGLGVVVCPSSMAGVAANRSRHQLRFEVDDVEGSVAVAVEARGRVHTPVDRGGGRVYAVVCDPDNNTLELVGPLAGEEE